MEVPIGVYVIHFSKIKKKYVLILELPVPVEKFLELVEGLTMLKIPVDVKDWFLTRDYSFETHEGWLSGDVDIYRYESKEDVGVNQLERWFTYDEDFKGYEDKMAELEYEVMYGTKKSK